MLASISLEESQGDYGFGIKKRTEAETVPEQSEVQPSAKLSFFLFPLPQVAISVIFFTYVLHRGLIKSWTSPRKNPNMHCVV